MNPPSAVCFRLNRVSFPEPPKVLSQTRLPNESRRAIQKSLPPKADADLLPPEVEADNPPRTKPPSVVPAAENSNSSPEPPRLCCQVMLAGFVCPFASLCP